MSATTPPDWVTSSFGESTETTPMQLAALGEHVSMCSRRGGRFSLLMCGVESLHAFVLGRLVTTVTVLVAVVGAAWLIAS